MPDFFCESNRWFRVTLCRRYWVVRFGQLSIPMRIDGAMLAAEWHWALGLLTDAQFEVIGAWPDQGPATARRIAADLYERGVERIEAVAAECCVLDQFRELRIQCSRNTDCELAESEALDPHLQRAIRWTDTAGRHLQRRMARLVKHRAPFADPGAAADFIAQALQRASRDLLRDRRDRKHPAPYGPRACVASLAANA